MDQRARARGSDLFRGSIAYPKPPRRLGDDLGYGTETIERDSGLVYTTRTMNLGSEALRASDRVVDISERKAHQRSPALKG